MDEDEAAISSNSSPLGEYPRHGAELEPINRGFYHFMSAALDGNFVLGFSKHDGLSCIAAVILMNKSSVDSMLPGFGFLFRRKK